MMFEQPSTPYSTSFRRRFWAYHHAVKPSYKKHSFSPKMCRKHFENRFSNKNLMSKNVFEKGFCIGKGDDPKIFNFGFWQIY